jgi:tight adherence protein B
MGLEIVETAVPFAILILLIVLGLVFYEGSRRADQRKQETLHRRISGSPIATESQTRPADGSKEPRQLPRFLIEPLRPVERWLSQAGLDLSAPQFMGLNLLVGVAGLLLTTLWLKVGIAWLSGVSLAGVPPLYVIVQRKRRLATFALQLPFVADFLRSTLRAGHPLARGLQMAAENAPEPTGTELRLAIEQMRYGSSLPDALDSMFKRVPEDSLGFFVAAVRVQAQVGSSLAEILDRIADAIRARQRLQQQIKTLTAQARMSGIVVGALPFFLLALFTLIRPDYTSLLFYDPMGIKMLEAAVTMDLIALFIINRMVRV